VTAGADLQAWCWREKPRPLSNSELFSLARDLQGRQEVSRDELGQAVQEALQGQPSPQASRQLEEQAARELQKALSGPSADGADTGQAEPSGEGESASGSSAAFADAARRLAATAGAASALAAAAEQVSTVKELESFVSRLEQELNAEGSGPGQEAGRGGEEGDEIAAGYDGVPGGTRQEGSTGGIAPEARDGVLTPGDAFPRSTEQPPDEELFIGIDHQEDKPGDLRQIEEAVPHLLLSRQLGAVKQILADHHRGERKASRHTEQPLTAQDLAAAMDQLLQLPLVSPLFEETFLVNRDAAAWLLAKKAYCALERLMPRRRPLRRGTHASGSRGVQTVLPDRVQPARRLSSRIAVLHTLRRSLRRRALSPYAPLLDEDDLIEYATRARVGCSVVLALDVSGAVQFGKRIQGVRRACMAFAYYARRFHPADRVRFVAYHETARVVPFADIGRLRAVNGAGKDIGGCLERCRNILRKEADRVPVVILMGDGLPARGDQAGFYRFMENNQEYIDRALQQARLLRQEHILFSFYQFMDERHLWRDYADDMARRITSSAGGTLYRIESPATMALSLMTAYDRLRSAVLE
jgi:Mg-chelatase subunit ChlD